MSKLEQLINELCPDGVEYKELETVCGFMSGFAFKTSTFTDSGEPICKTTNIQNNEISFQGMDCFNLSDYSENLDKYLIRPNDIVIGMSGTIKVGINRTSDCCYLNQRVGKFTPNETFLKNKFLYYILCNSVASLAYGITGGSVKNLSNKDILKLSIPVPPIEVQDEIVKILDNFTELTARKQQYEYYRDYLLSFDDEDIEKVIPDIDCSMVKMCPLSDVAEIYDGTHQTPNYTESGVPFISVENINSIYSSTKFISQEDFNKYKIKPKVNDVFMTRIGSIGACAVFDKQTDLAYYVSLALIRPNPELLNSKYLKYAIESKQGRKELRKRTLVNAVPIKINKNDIGKIILPIPSLETQNNIVKILDRFDMLCNGISEGIPAEIEARKQQYEYYRDTLLSFNQEQCSQIVNVERERERANTH